MKSPYDSNKKISFANRKEQRRVVFKTEWFTIDKVPYGTSDNGYYYRLSCNDSVSIITMTNNGKIIMVASSDLLLKHIHMNFLLVTLTIKSHLSGLWKDNLRKRQAINAEK